MKYVILSTSFTPSNYMSDVVVTLATSDYSFGGIDMYFLGRNDLFVHNWQKSGFRFVTYGH
jgi:hypothetical protein